MKYEFKRTEDATCDPRERIYLWVSEEVDSRGTREYVYCRVDWFWASPNGRWMLENEARFWGWDRPGFQSYRARPTFPGAVNDVVIL